MFSFHCNQLGSFLHAREMKRGATANALRLVNILSCPHIAFHAAAYEFSFKSALFGYCTRSLALQHFICDWRPFVVVP